MGYRISKLWLPLRQLLAFWLCLVFLAITSATTFAYDFGSQTKQAYDGTTNSVFRYGAARVLARHENPTSCPVSAHSLLLSLNFLPEKAD